jgi:NADP-dependent 3-hydroxy acid dehydrogenase YdfG
MNGSGYYVLFSYMPTFMNTELHFGKVQSLLVTASSLVATCIAIPYMGRLSDRVGRKKVIATAAIAMAVVGIPCYLLIGTGNLALAVLGACVMAVVFAGHTGVIHVLLVEYTFMPISDYRTALVTGASTGIGAVVVERLAKRGLEVHAVARNAERLRALADATGCIPHAVDITDTEALTAVLDGLEADILVNNAGVSRTGNILTADAFAVDEQITVNIQAVLHPVRLLMPGMVERDRGHIVNISSIAGVYNFGGNTIYHATKAAVHTLSRQLRVDGYGRRVRVTEICPGRVETEIFGRLLGDMEAAQRQFYDGYESLKPEDIADAIEFAVDSPRHVNIGHVEILPTFQVPGGLNSERREG